MSNVHRTVLYIGVTFDLESRVYEHESSLNKSFTKRYNCIDLIYYETFDAIESAIAREKAMKKWIENGKSDRLRF